MSFLARGFSDVVSPYNAEKYFRIGYVTTLCQGRLRILSFFSHRHMGITAVETSRGDVDAIIGALQATLQDAFANKKA